MIKWLSRNSFERDWSNTMLSTVRRLTPVEWATLVVALLLGIAVATYSGNLVAGIAVVVTLVITGVGFVYVRK